MHRWGDKDVDWLGIEDAAGFIASSLRKWGRISVDGKEKWGTVRVYCTLGWYQFHSITHPGYAFSQYPKWLWHLDCDWGPRILRPLNWIVLPYHRWLYRRCYQLALERWPHLRKEILSAADFSELLQGLEK